MDDRWFDRRFTPLKWLTLVAVAGVAIVVVSLFVDGNALWVLRVAGALLIIPVIFYVCLLPIWHWKERYVGIHSDLWGALLVIETSGFFKIVYWFRHILVDWQGRGRYAARVGARPSGVTENARPAV